MCEKTFETLANLETHIKHARYIVAHIKDHIIKVHDSEKYLMLDNFKISRDDCEEVTWRDFYFQF